MIRWLYTWLICLHPARFRERFGEQMTSVFDESLRQRGGIRLLADAAVSVLRQQLLRSDSSERRQAVARGLNLIWILSVIPVEIFVASELHPTTTTGNASVLYALLPVSMFLALYPLLNRGFSGEADGFTSISDPGQQRQTRLERRRDIFQAWAESTGIILLLILATWVVPVLIGLLFARALVARSWAIVYVIVIAIQTLTYFALLKRMNEKAVIALQQEIEAREMGAHT